MPRVTQQSLNSNAQMGEEVSLILAHLLSLFSKP